VHPPEGDGKDKAAHSAKNKKPGAKTEPSDGMPARKPRFARDLPLEGDGFEPLVPLSVLARESEVRTGLTAGGKWIRTLGSPRKGLGFAPTLVIREVVLPGIW
jgi:hypothetical protein